MRSLHVTQKKIKTKLTPGNASFSPSLNTTLRNSERYENFPQLQTFITESENNIRRSTILTSILKYIYGAQRNVHYQKYLYLISFLSIISCYIIHSKQNNLPWIFEDLPYNLNTSKNLDNFYDIQKSDPLLREIFQKLTLLLTYAKTLQNKINEVELKNKNLEKLINEIKRAPFKQTKGYVNSETAEIKAIMKDILVEYDNDKLGLTDYALESSGGSIISIEAKPSSIGAPVLTFLGLQLWTLLPNPRIILQGNIEPGNCFAFEGHSAKFNIQLLTTIFISAITMEHIPSSIAVDISSAPKDFSIMASVGNSLISLGTYTYKIPGPPKQVFEVNIEGSQYPHRNIQLQIHSNYGNELYTCLYRFRVHGEPLGKL